MRVKGRLRVRVRGRVVEGRKPGDTSVRDTSSKGHIMLENFQEFSFGDTTVGNCSTWHPAHHLHLHPWTN